jgi:hypothetical protein
MSGRASPAISRLALIGFATHSVVSIVSLIEYWPINDRAALVQGSGVQTAVLLHSSVTKRHLETRSNPLMVRF